MLSIIYKNTKNYIPIIFQQQRQYAMFMLYTGIRWGFLFLLVFSENEKLKHELKWKKEKKKKKTFPNDGKKKVSINTFA